MGLVSLYHDLVVWRYVKGLNKGVADSNECEQVTNVQAPISEKLAISIGVVQTAELLLEITALRKIGEQGRWITVFIIELLKYLKFYFKLFFNFF